MPHTLTHTTGRWRNTGLVSHKYWVVGTVLTSHIWSMVHIHGPAVDRLSDWCTVAENSWQTIRFMYRKSQQLTHCQSHVQLQTTLHIPEHWWSISKTVDRRSDWCKFVFGHLAWTLVARAPKKWARRKKTNRSAVVVCCISIQQCGQCSITYFGLHIAAKPATFLNTLRLCKMAFTNCHRCDTSLT